LGFIPLLINDNSDLSALAAPKYIVEFGQKYL